MSEKKDQARQNCDISSNLNNFTALTAYNSCRVDLLAREELSKFPDVDSCLEIFLFVYIIMLFSLCVRTWE